MFLIGFPLLLVPFAIYNIVAFLMPGVSWTGTLATVHMKSGHEWALSGGDLLVVLALLLLFVEMAKVVRHGRRSIVDHGLAFIVFGGMLAEFVLVAQAASAVFFLLVVMSFFDLLGGFALRVRYPRREPAVDHVEPAPAFVDPPHSEPAPVEPAPKAVAPASEHTPS
ncbi:MAG TPA: hypothetical protein VFW22_08715 [Pseudolabrys sp.]|nr:hypothetical protein [Pseudolabrys sp.]